MKYSYFWKRMLCCLLAVSSCAAFAGCQGKKPPVGSDGDTSTGDPEKPPLYTTPISEVIISSGEDRLAVNFCREDLVHFRFAPNGEDFVRKVYKDQRVTIFTTPTPQPVRFFQSRK